MFPPFPNFQYTYPPRLSSLQPLTVFFYLLFFFVTRRQPLLQCFSLFVLIFKNTDASSSQSAGSSALSLETRRPFFFFRGRIAAPFSFFRPPDFRFLSCSCLLLSHLVFPGLYCFGPVRLTGGQRLFVLAILKRLVPLPCSPNLTGRMLFQIYAVISFIMPFPSSPDPRSLYPPRALVASPSPDLVSHMGVCDLLSFLSHPSILDRN